MQPGTKTLSVALALAVALGGCSSFSKSGRQRRAYEKYVRKSSVARGKQRARMGKVQMPPPQEFTQPTESTETGPQAVPSDG